MSRKDDMQELTDELEDKGYMCFSMGSGYQSSYACVSDIDDAGDFDGNKLPNHEGILIEEL